MNKKKLQCPDWLEDEAKKEWDRIIALSTIKNLQNDIDEIILSGYCQVYARWKEAEKFITKYGPVYKAKSGAMRPMPQVDMAQKYLLIMHKLYKELNIPIERQLIANNDNKVIYISHNHK